MESCPSDRNTVYSNSCENSNKYYCLHAENSNDFWTLDRSKIGTNYSRNTEEYSSNQEYCEFDPENSNASRQ